MAFGLVFYSCFCVGRGLAQGLVCGLAVACMCPGRGCVATSSFMPAPLSRPQQPLVSRVIPPFSHAIA